LGLLSISLIFPRSKYKTGKEKNLRICDLQIMSRLIAKAPSTSSLSYIQISFKIKLQNCTILGTGEGVESKEQL
jgi:hypothetical protein